MIATTNEVDLEVFRRYAGLSLPRHVSYPMPSWWHEMNAEEAAALFQDSHRQTPGYDLSLYLHIPYCEALCKFCACNRVIQRKASRGAAENTERYVMALMRDIRATAATVEGKRTLRQIHWGGGSPSYLSIDQIRRIEHTILDTFELAADAEIAMEIDPRTVGPEELRQLRELGFNRISFGVQDFDEQVQEHVHRVQPYEMVRYVVAVCRDLRFDSVNFDLIYGLPYQTVDTVRDTVRAALALSPNRVAFYHYAQIPEKIATQRGIDHTKLPDSETKLAMFLLALRLFEEAGYQFVGLDHFARPDESLARALKAGTLQRNFQGMSTGGGLRLLGVGVSAITHLLDVGFLQNVKGVEDYVTRIEAGRSPVERGKRLSRDDCIRQALLNELYCTARIQPDNLEKRFDIRFVDYFADELDTLRELESDGLVTVDESGGVRVTHPLGRILMRNVAAVFDAYLDPTAYRNGQPACFSTNA